MASLSSVAILLTIQSGRISAKCYLFAFAAVECYPVLPHHIQEHQVRGQHRCAHMAAGSRHGHEGIREGDGQAAEPACRAAARSIVVALWF